ncbi:MAG: hypothetical protein LV481_04415 [Methylacidiphilales bacterium]|nr:hypothetical protein [Candidatus Methylacidiphilales bacterium]
MKLHKLNARLFQIARTWADQHFNPAVGLILARHPPSVHTVGNPAHLLRESLYYAYGLLFSGSKDELLRAIKIIDLVLTKQNLDSSSQYWACFTCEWEQDWETWSSPDMNWAQFMGLILAFILTLDKEKGILPAESVEKIRVAFDLTVKATLRRDVTPSYTNISFLSAAVAAAGTTILGDKNSEEFAFRKLTEVHSRLKDGGTFDEYLSPTYYGTNLYGLYAAKLFAPSERVRNGALGLIDFLWNDISASYHPKTCQLAGPHSRAYGDNMLDYEAKIKNFIYLALEGNYPLNDVEISHSHDSAGLFIISTLEVDAIPELGKHTSGYRELSIPSDKGESHLLRQYREDCFILGTVNEQDEWQQRRNLLAYWVVDGVHKVGIGKGAAFLDGGEFKPARFYSSQVGPSALVALNLSRTPKSRAKAGYRFTVNAVPNHHIISSSGDIMLQFSGRNIRIAPFPLGPKPELLLENEITSIVWTFPADQTGNAWLAFAVAFSQPDETISSFERLSAVFDKGKWTFSAILDEASLELSVLSVPQSKTF